ncbi:ATPase [Tabrizicola sp. TH137]|uniref:sensor histidine kinase n=1 Tax=Tabrizicola sp. TH137 TaxID=2067452 RepID=UPI000C7BBA76|nr:sensor histidine kinase [Tabrizicola sp. TH137]PLL12992.1 ATPase [Tabrizicola sp. TH137]
MNRAAETAAKGPPPLKAWLWRSYLRAALVPLLLIELTFVALYWGTSRVVYDRSAGAITEISTAALGDAALREADVIARRLETIAALTGVYAEETGRALALPAPEVPEAERANHALSPEGVFHSKTDRGGSAVFVSGVVPVGPVQEDKVWRTLRLDPVMKSIRAADPLIAQLYVNTSDSLNRIYPWFDVLAIYPPRMDIPSYNFYYEADAVHNPGRGVVWTDAYVDPAGAGWMVSAIAPVYGADDPDRLDAVVGLDITTKAIVDQVLDIDFKGDGYAILVSRDGTILALPPEAEGDLGVSALLEHSYEEAILQDTFKPDSFNIYRRAELFDLAQALQSAPEGDARVDLGRPMMAAWATIAGPQWKLMVLTSEESLLAAATTLRDELTFVSWAMLGILILFYGIFFLFLWRRSIAMSARVAQPLAEIEGNMARITEGGTVAADHRYGVAELQAVGDHLVNMGTRLQAANAAKANFLSAMSHELRTPLNAILGFSELLKNDPAHPLPPEAGRQVQAISDAGWQLLQLVEGVIELSRIERGEVRNNRQPIQIIPLAQQAVEAARPGLRSHDVTLSVEMPETPLPQAMADPEILLRILTHLVSNGVKYNRAGGSVTLSFRQEPGRLAIRVQDTGIGIPPDRQARLFTPFDRLGHENGTISGTGIGLAICRRLADLTGSSISYESHEGQGSTFTLRVPLA